MWGKLMCKLLGHKRGKRITVDKVPASFAENVVKDMFDTHFLGCPRCGAVWYRQTRKVKAKAAT